ncbi:MAG: MBL fold metallo-hydrolase, partial [Methyloligellaceae bacterium]
MSSRFAKFSRRDLLAGAAGTAALTALSGHPMPRVEAKAPMLGAARPTHYRFKIGAFEITTIYDGALAIPKVHPIFGLNQKQEDVQAYLSENHLPASKMTISFTPVIVNTGKEVVMFDSGYGEERRAKGAGLLAAALATAGFSPDQIDVIVLTHLHPDHVSGLMENGKAMFPNARYVTGDVEYNFWSKKDLLEGSDKNMIRRAQAVHNNVVPLAQKIKFIKPGADVVTGVTSVRAFGHTPGHMCYHIENAGKRFLVFADTTNH